jgi:hypothetical protein
MTKFCNINSVGTGDKSLRYPEEYIIKIIDGQTKKDESYLIRLERNVLVDFFGQVCHEIVMSLNLTLMRQ